MHTNNNGDVNAPLTNSNTLDYKIQQVSVKLTEKIEKQLDYIANQTMSRSNIIRSIT